MAMDFSWRIRQGSPVPTVEVIGELDLESGPYLREQLGPIMRALGAHLAIDLTGVTFIDCSGVNALLASGRDARRLGGGMRVAGAAPCVRRLAELTGLQQVLGGPEIDDDPILPRPWTGGRPAGALRWRYRRQGQRVPRGAGVQAVRWPVSPRAPGGTVHRAAAQA